MSGSAQPTLSAYFKPTVTPSSSKIGRRISSPIDLTGEYGTTEIPRKRLRLTSPDESLPSLRSDASPSAVDNWRYSPDKQKTQQSRPSEPRTRRDEKRLAAFKRSLLQDNNRFLTRDSPEGEDVGGAVESDPFDKLTDMFSHQQKNKSKVKGKALASTSKKAGELGPSGKLYTPLEKQVSGSIFHSSSPSPKALSPI